MALFGRAQIMGKPPAGASFFTDPFTGDVFHLTWTNGAWSTSSAVLTGDRMSSTTNSSERNARCDEDLGTVDHWVEIDVVVQNGGSNVGILARCNSTTNTNYMGRWNGTDWQIYRRVAGAFTLLASAATPDPSIPFRMRLETENNAGNVDLRLYEQTVADINGGKTLRVSFTDSNAARILTGNLTGVRPVGDGSSGCSADNFACGAL